MGILVIVVEGDRLAASGRPSVAPIGARCRIAPDNIQ
jgi:hypothetical protein